MTPRLSGRGAPRTAVRCRGQPRLRGSATRRGRGRDRQGCADLAAAGSIDDVALREQPDLTIWFARRNATALYQLLGPRSYAGRARRLGLPARWSRPRPAAVP